MAKANGRRTSFGERVYAWRRKLRLTQRELAELANHPDHPTPDQGTVSARTLWEIERRLPENAPRKDNLPSTIRALARAFGLQPDTPEFMEFLTLAGITAPDEAATSFPEPEVPLFVPVGREAHIARLETAIDRAAGGEAGVVFVEAEAGGGKSSLVAHVCRGALDRHERLVVLWGDCTGRAGAADPWQPFRQAASTLAGDTAAPPPQHILSRRNASRIAHRAPVAIRALVDEATGLIDRFVSVELLQEQARTGRLDAETGRRLDRALTAAPAASAIFEPNQLVYRLLRRYAGAGPVILVLEDLHWADTGTADTLFHLMRRLEKQRLPILVIVTYRPLDLESARLGDHEAVRNILTEAPRLFPDSLLDLADTVGGIAGRAFVEAVVDRLMPEASRSFREILFAESAGLPLFVITILESRLAEDQAIATGTDGNAMPRRLRLPAAIEALFARAVDRLPPDLKRLLEAASVQGTTFSAEVLREMTGVAWLAFMEQLDDQLARRYRAIAPAGVSTIAGQRSHDYQFSHALFRDFVYASLSIARRDALHTETATAMIALYGNGEHAAAGRIAHHYDQAGKRRDAASAHVRAGLYGMSQHEYAAARRHFERVGKLDLEAEDPFVVAQALVGLGNCAYGEGQLTRASSLFRQAQALALRERLPLLQAICLTSMGRLDFDAGRMRQGAGHVAAAIELFAELGEAVERSRSLALLSHLHYGLGEYDAAIRFAQAAIDLGAGLGDDLRVVDGLTALANCWLDLGRYDGAETDLRRAIALSDEHGSGHRATLCWVNLALAHIERRDWAGASDALDIVFDPDRLASPRLIGLAEFNAGLVAEGQGDWPQANARYGASRAIRLVNGQHALALDSLAGLVRTATAESDPGAMAALGEELAGSCETRGLDGVGHPALLFLSMIGSSVAAGDASGARDWAKRGTAFVCNRAHGLANPDHRRTYVSEVSAHRTLFALAAELGVPAG